VRIVVAGVGGRNDFVRFNYKGAPSAITDMISCQFQFVFGVVVSVLSHVKMGLMKALVVISARPPPLASDLLTVAASGLPGYESVGVLGIFAPAGTPEALVQRLNREIAQMRNKGDVNAKVFDTGAETTKLKIKRVVKFIEDAGIRANSCKHNARWLPEQPSVTFIFN
jgi:tripartite-type tricarboxylate transporter receptor subunit TctC